MLSVNEKSVLHWQKESESSASGSHEIFGNKLDNIKKEEPMEQDDDDCGY
jgi:hypothetical protein